MNLNKASSDSLIGKYFIGEVKVNLDPNKLHRIKVFIPELFEGYADDDLPWFGCIRPIFQGNSNNTGWIAIPRVGSRVVCVFDKGNVNSGLVIGELMDSNNKIEVISDPNYPECWGFRDENNTYLKVNTQTKLMELHHSSGTKIVIDVTGNTNVTVVDNCVVDITSNATINVGGNTTLTSGGPVQVTAPKISLN